MRWPSKLGHWNSLREFRAAYGSSPLHLLAHLAAFFVAAWAISHVFDGREPWNWVVWLVAAALLHDLALLPFYSLLDRVARAAVPRRAINHVRVPALMSGVMFLVFFPRILNRVPGNYVRAAGVEPTGYLRNWLAITAVLFLTSAALYAGRSARSRLHGPSPPTSRPG